MGRIVEGAAPTPKLAQEVDAQGQDIKKGEGDSYLERVAKYIPAEVIAFFVFVNGLLSEAAKKLDGFNVANSIVDGDAKNASSALCMKAIEALTEQTDRISVKLDCVKMANGSISVSTVASMMLWLGALMTIVYLISRRDTSKPNEYLGLNIAVSLVGFFVWAYALDAVALRHIYDGVLASILLAAFTLVSGAISPAAQDQIMNLVKPKTRE